MVHIAHYISIAYLPTFESTLGVMNGVTYLTLDLVEVSQEYYQNLHLPLTPKTYLRWTTRSKVIFWWTGQIGFRMLHSNGFRQIHNAVILTSPFHIVQITHFFWNFSCKDKSETFTEFDTSFVVTRNIKKNLYQKHLWRTSTKFFTVGNLHVKGT